MRHIPWEMLPMYRPYNACDIALDIIRSLKKAKWATQADFRASLFA